MNENFNAAPGGQDRGSSSWDSLTEFGHVDIGGEVSNTEKLGGTREVGSAGEPGAEYADNDNAEHINDNTEYDNSDTEHIHGNTEHIEEVNAGDGANSILKDVTGNGAGWSPEPGQILEESIKYLGYVQKNQVPRYDGAKSSPEVAAAEKSTDGHVFSREKFEELKDKESELHDAVLDASKKVGSQTCDNLKNLNIIVSNNLSDKGKDPANYCFKQLMQSAVYAYGGDSRDYSNTGFRNSYLFQSTPGVIDAEDAKRLSTTDVLLAVIDKHFPSRFQNDFSVATDGDYVREASDNDNKFMKILRECEETFFNGRRSPADLGLTFQLTNQLGAIECNFAKEMCDFLNYPTIKGTESLKAFHDRQTDNQSSAIIELGERLGRANVDKEIGSSLAKLAEDLKSTKNAFFESVLNYIYFKMEHVASPDTTSATTNSSPNKTTPESGKPRNENTRAGEKSGLNTEEFV